MNFKVLNYSHYCLDLAPAIFIPARKKKLFRKKFTNDEKWSSANAKIRKSIRVIYFEIENYLCIVSHASRFRELKNAASYVTTGAIEEKVNAYPTFKTFQLTTSYMS